MLVVAVFSCGEKARLRIFTDMIARCFKSLDLSNAHKVEARESQDDMTVVVPFERERVPMLEDGLHDVAINAPVLDLTEEVLELRSRHRRPRHDSLYCHVSTPCNEHAWYRQAGSR